MSKRVLLTVALMSSVAHAAPRVLTGLVVERGSNFQSLANERIQIRYDGAVLYERGRPITRKDPKHGTVTVGACDRYTWRLTPKEVEALRIVVDKADVASLRLDYRREGVHDGSQAALLASYTDLVVVSRFDNELPPPYAAVSQYLSVTLLKDAEKKGKKGRCDTASWLFLSPPGDQP